MLSRHDDKILKELYRGAAIPRTLPVQAVTQKSSVQVPLSEGSCIGVIFPGAPGQCFGYMIEQDTFGNPLSYTRLLWPTDNATVGSAINPVAAHFSLVAATQSTAAAIVGGYANASIPSVPFIQALTLLGSYESPLSIANAESALAGQPVYDGFSHYWWGTDTNYVTINNDVPQTPTLTNVNLSETRGAQAMIYSYSTEYTDSLTEIKSIDLGFGANAILGSPLPVLAMDSITICGSIAVPTLSYNNTGFILDLVVLVRIRGFNAFGSTLFSTIQQVGTYTSLPGVIVPGDATIQGTNYPFRFTENQANMSGTPDVVTSVQVDYGLFNSGHLDYPLNFPVTGGCKLVVEAPDTNREGVNRGYITFALRGIPDGNAVNITATRNSLMRLDASTVVFVDPLKQKYKPLLREALQRVLSDPIPYGVKPLFARSMSSTMQKHFLAALTMEEYVEEKEYEKAAALVSKVLQDYPYEDVEYDGLIASPVSMSIGSLLRGAKRIAKKATPKVAQLVKPYADVLKQVGEENWRNFKKNGLQTSEIITPLGSVALPNPLAEFKPRKSDGSYYDLNDQIELARRLIPASVPAKASTKLVFVPRTPVRMSTGNVGGYRDRLVQPVAQKTKDETTEELAVVPFSIKAGRFIIIPGIQSGMITIGRANLAQIDSSSLWAITSADQIPPLEKAKYKVFTVVNGKKLYGWRPAYPNQKPNMTMMTDMAVVRVCSKPNIKEISVEVPTVPIEDRSLELALKVYPSLTTAAFSGALHGTNIEPLPPDVGMAKKSVCAANGIALIANSPFADYNVTTLFDALKAVHTVKMSTQVDSSPVITTFNTPSGRFPEPRISLPIARAAFQFDQFFNNIKSIGDPSDEDVAWMIGESIGSMFGKSEPFRKMALMLFETNPFYRSLKPSQKSTDFDNLIFYSFYFYCLLNNVNYADFTTSDPVTTITECLGRKSRIKMTFLNSGVLYFAMLVDSSPALFVFDCEEMIHRGFLCPTFENIGSVRMSTGAPFSPAQMDALRSIMREEHLGNQRQQRRNGPLPDPDIQRTGQARRRFTRRTIKEERKNLARQVFDRRLTNLPRDVDVNTFVLFPWAPKELLKILPSDVNAGDSKSVAAMLTALTTFFEKDVQPLEKNEMEKEISEA